MCKLLTQQEKLDLIEKERAKNSVRNPGLAVILSFFVIGLGQIYNGKISKGLIMLLSHILLTILGVNLFFLEQNVFIYIVGDESGLVVLRLLYIFAHFSLFFFNLRDAFLESKYSGLIQKFQNPEVVEIDGNKYLMLGYESDNLPVVQSLDENIPQKYQRLENDVMVSFAWKRILLLSIVVFLIGTFAGKAVFNRIEENKVISVEKKFETKFNNNPDNYDTILEYSDYLIKNSKYIKALNLLKKAVSIKPERSGAHFSLGIVYRNLGIKNQEDIEFKKALMLSKSGNNNMTFEGTEMIDDWINAIRKNPKNSNAYFNLGKIYFIKGMTQEALYSFSKATEFRKDHFESYFIIGEILEKNGDLKNALKQFNQAYKYQKSNITVIKKLAQLNYMTNHLEQADNFYEILYKENELNKDDLITFLKNKIKIGNPEKASSILDIEISKNTDEVRLLKIKLQIISKNDIDGKMPVLEKIISKSKNDFTVLNQLISIYTSKKMINKCKKLLSTVSSDYFKNTNNLDIVLAFYTKSGNIEMQKKYLKSVMRTSIPFASKKLNLFFTIIKNEGFHKIDVLFLQEMSLKFPNNAEILSKLAEIFTILKEIDNEIEVLKKLIIIQPKNIKVINRLADNYFKKEKIEDALIFYKQMEVLHKGNEKLYNSMLKIYKSMGAHKKVIEVLKNILRLKGGKDISLIKQIYSIAKKNIIIDELSWSLKLLSELIEDNSAYLEELAGIYLKKKNYTKAIKIWENILASNPISQSAMYELKNLYKLSKKDSKLKMILERIVFYNRQDIASNQELAIFYEKIGDIKLEFLLWENVIHMYPLNLKGLQRLSVLYKKLGTFTKLIGVLEKLLVVDSDRKSNYAKEIFDCYIKIGDTNKALEYGEFLLNMTLNKDITVSILQKMIPLYIEKRQYRKVIPIYEMLIKENPFNKNALKSLLVIYEKLSNVQKQEELLNKLITIEKDSVEYEKKLLLILVQQNQFNRARKIFDTLVSNNVYFSDSLLTKLLFECINNRQNDFLRVIMEFIKNKKDFLKKQFKEIQSVVISSELINEEIGIDILNIFKQNNLDNDITNFHLGKYYYQNKNYDLALKLLKKVRFENNDKANRMKADIYISKGNKIKAIYYYKESLKFAPDQYDLKLKISEIYISAYQYKAAISWADKVLKTNPSNREAMILLGITNKRMKKYSSAEKYYNDALAIENDSKTYIYLGFVLEKQKKFDEAFSSYISAYKLVKDNEKKELIKSLIKTGKKVPINKIITNIYNILEITNVEFLENILDRLEKERESDTALKVSEKLLSLNENDKPALNFMGNYYFNNSHYGKAEEYYKKIPSSNSINIKLALICINSGRRNEAKEILVNIINTSKKAKIKSTAKTLLKTLE